MKSAAAAAAVATAEMVSFLPGRLDGLARDGDRRELLTRCIYYEMMYTTTRHMSWQRRRVHAGTQYRHNAGAHYSAARVVAKMEVVDLYCGLGGFAAGALEVPGCTVVLGVDHDSVPLKLFAANTGAKVALATLGPNGNAVQLPPPSPKLHVHVRIPGVFPFCLRCPEPGTRP